MAIDAWAVQIEQRNADNNGSFVNFLSLPAGDANGLVGLNGATKLPVYFSLGSGLTYNGLSVEVGSVPQSSITGLSTALAGKQDILPTQSGQSGKFLTTNGSLMSWGTPSFSLPNVGTAGTYDSVTTDAQGRVVSGTTLSINNSPGRSLVSAPNATGFQISSTRNVLVCYEGKMTTITQALVVSSGNSEVAVHLEIANTNSTNPTDWTTIATQNSSQNIALGVAITSTDGEPWSLCRVIPAGKFVRIRSQIISGTGATFSINSTQQETQL